MHPTSHANASSAVRRRMIAMVLPVLALALQVVPVGIAAWIADTLPAPSFVRMPVGMFAYLLAQPLFAAICSLPFRRSMIEGRFPRDLGHPVYGFRRLHGACWTAVYYNALTYPLVLSIPLLKHSVLRLFGYRGDCAFTIYPDTWIRDVPLLSIGRGAYLSNRATISPNIATPDGALLVAPVCIGEDAMVGHAALLAPGVTIGARTVVGVGCAINTGVRIGDESTIGNMTDVDHDVLIASRATVGASNTLGARAYIGSGMRTPTCLFVPRKHVIASHEQAQELADLQGIGNATVSAR